MFIKGWYGTKESGSPSDTTSPGVQQHQSLARLLYGLIWTSPILTISSFAGIACILSHTSNVQSSIGIGVFVVSVLTAFREYNHQATAQLRNSKKGRFAKEEDEQDEIVYESQDIRRRTESPKDRNYRPEGESKDLESMSPQSVPSSKSPRYQFSRQSSSNTNSTPEGDGALMQIRNHDSVMDFGSYSSDEGEQKLTLNHARLRSILKSARAENKHDHADNHWTPTVDSSFGASSDDGVPLNPTGYISLMPSGSSHCSHGKSMPQGEESPRDLPLDPVVSYPIAPSATATHATLASRSLKNDPQSLRHDSKNVYSSNPQDPVEKIPDEAPPVEMSLDNALSTMIQQTITQMEESSLRMRSLVLQRAERLKRMQYPSRRGGPVLSTNEEKTPLTLLSELVEHSEDLGDNYDVEEEEGLPMATLSIVLTDDRHQEDDGSDADTDVSLQPYQSPLTLQPIPSSNSMFCTPLGAVGGIIATGSMMEEIETMAGRDECPYPVEDTSSNCHNDTHIAITLSTSSAPDDEKREDVKLMHVQHERQKDDFHSFVNKVMAQNEKGILGMAEAFGNSIHTRLAEELRNSIQARFGF